MKDRIQKNQKFLLGLINLNLFGYYPLRKWLGIDHKGKIDEVSHLSIAYNTKDLGNGKIQQTREYQQPDLGYKLNLVLDKIPQLALLPALLQPAYGLGALVFFMTTETYQPSTKDSYLSSLSANTNYGSLESIKLHYNSSLGYHYRIIIHFDISDLPSETSVQEADMNLYLYEIGVHASQNMTGYFNRLTRTNWTEAGVTWNKYDGTNNWTTAGGDYTTDDQSSASLPNTAGAWVEWDIKNIAQYSIDSVSGQIHLLGTRSSGSWSNGSHLFCSKEYTDDTSKRPKLTVTYTIYHNLRRKLLL